MQDHPRDELRRRPIHVCREVQRQAHEADQDGTEHDADVGDLDALAAAPRQHDDHDAEAGNRGDEGNSLRPAPSPRPVINRRGHRQHGETGRGDQ